MPTTSRVLAVLASAVLGVAAGVVGGLVFDRAPAGPDPLGLGVPMVNQPCTGQSLLVTATSAGVGGLGQAVADNPDNTRYLQIARSCPTAWKANGEPAHGYAAYLGPYSVSQACAERMTVAHRGDLVTRLHAGNTQPVQCLCYLDAKTMPVLRPNMDADIVEGIYVRALQKVLVTLGLGSADRITGVYDQATVDHVTTFQRDNALPQLTAGTVDVDTWRAILAKACKSYNE